jgi:DNA-binding protein YbaB
MFAELSSETLGIKREMRQLIERVQEMEDMERGLVESEEGMEQEVDRGEGTSTGRREVWRNEIDMEVSDEEDTEGMEDNTEKNTLA